jgi:ADP-ribosyl-[dinitrogen reductase] hydrolase
LDEREARRDRYRGALLAGAAGDALGATLEFMTPEAIQQQHGQLRDIIGGGWLALVPGEITDDTQMALCIARSLVERGAFDADDIAARFVEWRASQPKDIGNTTAHALEQLAHGVPWQEAGQRTHEAMRPNDASNGSIMRCAPIALYARVDPARNAQLSADASRITHANPLCVAASVALNAAIAALLNDPAADPLAVALAATDNETLRTALATVPASVPADLRAKGYVLDTMQAAFWAVTQHSTLDEAIIAGVNLGQDSDTTGAVAGALAGARWGMAAIPDRWLHVLQPRDELIALADGLLELAG